MLLMAFSLSILIVVITPGFQLVLCLTAWIFSIALGLIENLCIRSWIRVGCHLTSLEAVLVTGLLRGWEVGRVAKCMAALWQWLLTMVWIGGKFAKVATASAAVVLCTPVINIVTFLCIAANLLYMAFLLLPFLLPTCCWGVRKISAA